MKTYTVLWEIELDANSHREAAEKAKSIQLDACSLATCFDVICLDSESNEIEVVCLRGDV